MFLDESFVSLFVFLCIRVTSSVPKVAFTHVCIAGMVVVVVLGFYVSPTAKVIQREWTSHVKINCFATCCIC